MKLRHSPGSATKVNKNLVGPRFDDVEQVGSENQGASEIEAYQGELVKIPGGGFLNPITGKRFLRDPHEVSAQGPGSEEHVKIWFADIVEALQELVVWQRAQIPIMQVNIDGPSSLNQQGQQYSFIIDNERVIALRLYIQNNTAGVIYYGLSQPASIGGLQIAAAGIVNLANVAVDYISLMAAGGSPPVAGIRNTQMPNAANAVVVNAWSNPEFRRMWGSI
jgi:hypothetical protein